MKGPVYKKKNESFIVTIFIIYRFVYGTCINFWHLGWYRLLLLVSTATDSGCHGWPYTSQNTVPAVIFCSCMDFIPRGSSSSRQRRQAPCGTATVCSSQYRRQSPSTGVALGILDPTLVARHGPRSTHGPSISEQLNRSRGTLTHEKFDIMKNDGCGFDEMEVYKRISSL
jgi:hypothetical protein